MTATAARKNFYAVIKAAEHRGVSFAITHQGIPKVVVMSFEEFEGWMETMEIMADPELSKGLKEDIQKSKAGTLDTIDYDAFKKKLKL